MAVGYACIHIGSYKKKLLSARIKNATEENLIKIIESNWNALEEIIRCNIEDDIHLFG